MSEYIQNGTSLYKKVGPNKRVDYKTDIDEFEFKRTPETDAMLKQLCVEGIEEPKMEVVRCKDCKYWAEFTFNIPPFHYCGRLFQDGNTESIGFYMEADDFCSRGERK